MEAVTGQIASFQWDLDPHPGLLTDLSDAMVDETNWLSERRQTRLRTTLRY